MNFLICSPLFKVSSGFSLNVPSGVQCYKTFFLVSYSVCPWWLLSDVSVRVASWPYPQIFDKTGKACQTNSLSYYHNKLECLSLVVTV